MSAATIGSRLREAREMGGLAARELDRLARKTPGHCGLIENRDADAMAGTLEAYAEILGVSLDWLIAAKEENKPTEEHVRAAVERARAAVEKARAAAEKARAAAEKAPPRKAKAMAMAAPPTKVRRRTTPPPAKRDAA